MAHDLRSPLAGALGAAQILADATDPITEDERLDFAAMLVESLSTANNIVRELLVLAEVRQAEIRVVPLDMSVVVAAALACIAGPVREAGATIVPPPAWPSARATRRGSKRSGSTISPTPSNMAANRRGIEMGADTAEDGQVRFWVREQRSWPDAGTAGAALCTVHPA